MRVVKMMYGLGNQLFQYAFYKKLTLLYGKDVFVDTEWYSVAERNPWDVYQLDIIGLFPKKIPRTDYCVKDYYIRNNGITEEEFEQIKAERNVPVIDLVSEEPYSKDHRKIWLLDNVYYWGFFQNIETVDMGITEIKKEIRFPDWDSYEYNRIKDMIMSDDRSVSIHMRMDNHVKEQECYDSICTDLYFKRSIDTILGIVPDASFYVFSNNLRLARERLSHIDRIVFVEMDNPHYGIEDLELMSLCRHNIISNSTFSWWAAVLNPNPDNTVIIPDVFDTRMKEVKKDDVNLYYPGWIRISG